MKRREFLKAGGALAAVAVVPLPAAVAEPVLPVPTGFVGALWPGLQEVYGYEYARYSCSVSYGYGFVGRRAVAMLAESMGCTIDSLEDMRKRTQQPAMRDEQGT